MPGAIFARHHSVRELTRVDHCLKFGPSATRMTRPAGIGSIGAGNNSVDAWNLDRCGRTPSCARRALSGLRVSAMLLLVVLGGCGSVARQTHAHVVGGAAEGDWITKIYAVEGLLPPGYQPSRKPARRLAAQDVDMERDAAVGTHYNPADCGTALRPNLLPVGSSVAGVTGSLPSRNARIEFTVADTAASTLAISPVSDDPKCAAVTFSGRVADWPDTSGITLDVAAPHVEGIRTQGRQWLITVRERGNRSDFVEFDYVAQLNDRRRLVATFLAPRDDHWRTLSPFDMQRLFAEVAHLMSGE